MGKYLVVVDASYLAAADAMRSVATVNALPLTGSDRYDHRRRSLLDVAQQVLSPAAARVTPAAEGAVRALTDWPSLATSSLASAVVPVLPAGVQMLEALGALIVEDEQVDPNLLAHVTGLQLFADVTIDLPAPMNANAMAAPPWHLAHIDGHGVVPGTGKNVLVGVLDSGIDASHSEFAGKAIYFAEFDSAGVMLTAAAHDAGNHGTHVCSLIAGATCGVAPDAELAVAAVLTTRGFGGVMSGGLVQIASGLNWLLQQTFGGRGPQGVDIINASLGGRGYNGYLRAPLTGALVLPGTLTVAAIGNSGLAGIGCHGSPGNYPEVLGVGAIDSGNVVADFSDWGPSAVPAPSAGIVSKPDLSAPGVAVVGALPGGGFGTKDGTSMASPLVCGLGARMLQANPALLGNPAQLRADLQARAALNPVTPNPAGNTGGVGQI
jgi:hypothetical protein